jgi:phosphoglycerol transferase MdoB-like AlkP superfamily enzyme
LQLEYGEKFWNAYEKSRKFLFLAFLHGHEPTYSVVKYIDKPIVEFLNRLEKNDKLKDTCIFFVGDHGLHISPIYALLAPENYSYQIVLPALFIVFNYNKNLKINEIYDNQQKLVTPYDIYETMFHIIFGNNYKKQKRNKLQRKSLFKYINETERNCSLYSEIKIKYCKCIIKN